MQSRYPVTRILFGVLISLLGAPLGRAQSTGVVSISGSVSPFTKLTSGGSATLTGNSGGGVTVVSANDAPLATVVNFGEVGPGNTSTYVCFTQPLLMRSNVAASVRAAVTAAAFGAGPGDLKKTDIGVGLRNLSASGPNADISNTTILAAFSADPCAAPIGAGGTPTYSATLNSLATVTPGTTLLSTTSAWSLRGSPNAASNGARVDFKLAIVPQSFTAGTFSATVTLTVTSP